MDLVFAPATPERLDDVDRLMRAAFAPYVRALGRELTADAYGWFPEAIAKGDIFVARDGTEIVGAIATRPRRPEIELALIGVSPARQKGGIAGWMLERVEEIARGRGLAVLSLNTAEMMEDRVRLYARHGFRIVRRGPPEHGKDAHTRVFMEKVLAG
jgi:GNAT superfamily N-acetyltransferase